MYRKLLILARKIVAVRPKTLQAWSDTSVAFFCDYRRLHFYLKVSLRLLSKIIRVHCAYCYNCKHYLHAWSFGELALMYNCPRNATIIAQSEGILWALDQAVFRRIVVGAAARKRRSYESLLEGVPMLSELTEYERANLRPFPLQPYRSET